jgi:hypothetical protein
MSKQQITGTYYEIYSDIENLDWSVKRLRAAGAKVVVVPPLKDYQQSQRIARNPNK